MNKIESAVIEKIGEVFGFTYATTILNIVRPYLIKPLDEPLSSEIVPNPYAKDVVLAVSLALRVNGATHAEAMELANEALYAVNDAYPHSTFFNRVSGVPHGN